ncbi:Antimicrobial peptide NKlysinlike [Caligus rogercresseyi]|uniref:Antimicrobial peptide NKlysinlike n=1 Tax=Caligus rogercresseyi TaxID=217165 RepID=A0A7T8QSN9_CALRO|nr:Antimicrobial peptide NKlysinlike [Caligus rogercresseyi]
MASAATVTKDLMIEKDLKCDICKLVFGKLNDEVLTQDNADEALAKLENVSSFVGETCTKFVEEIVKPKIDEILANKPEPEAACQELELC